jgi:cell division transport system permease protein
MIGRRSLDLPLAADASGGALVPIIAAMVWLALLALAGTLTLTRLGQHWETGLSGSLTVQIAPGEEAAPGGAASLAQRTELALALLRATPGIARAEPVGAAATARLLEPWLGGSLSDDLPLPALIDVTLVPGGRQDSAALAARLAAAVPGARLDAHAVWLADLRTLARMIQAVAILVMVLVGGVAVVAVVFAVRSGLAVHHPVVELLHLMGATDTYVAWQFQSHALTQSGRGALAGAALAATTLGVLGRVAPTDSLAMLLPALTPGWGDLLALLAVPAGAIALAALTARWTVLRVLARMP